MPVHLGSFILCNSSRITYNFIREIDGSKTNTVFYTDTDTLFSQTKLWDVFDTSVLIGESLFPGRNDYKNGGFFHALFLAPKMKYFFRIDEKGIIDDIKTLRGFTDSHRLLNKIQCLQMLKSRDFYDKLPSSWKKNRRFWYYYH